MSNQRRDAELEKIIAPLIRYWQSSNEAWWVKNNQSQFVYVNSCMRNFMVIPSAFKIEGRYDGELPIAMHEFEAEFQAGDRWVEQQRERLTTLEIHKLGEDDFFQAWNCDKFPVIGEDGHALGVIVHNRPLDSFSLSRINKFRAPDFLTFTPPNDRYSIKEWEVIFYTCQSFTPKMIESAVGIPNRTVEDMLERIYKKSGTKNKRDFINYCMDHGFNNFIPQSIFQTSGSIIPSEY